MANIVEMLFGCRHNNMSFPMTAKLKGRRHAAAQVTGTYQVCLDCGKEFAYDWNEMRMVSGREEKRAVATAAGFESAA